VKCGVALAKEKVKGAAGGDVIVAADPPKDPMLMAILTGCCLVGVGQIILGQTAKGVSILIGSIALALITMGISAPVTMILAAVDAYKIAKKLKEGKTVPKWEFF
jgi:hypothetical protein